MKKIVITGAFLGSFIGSYIPLLWGDGVFSVSSIIFGGVGALVGIWIAYKVVERI